MIFYRYQLCYLALMLAVFVFCQHLGLEVPVRSHATCYCHINRDPIKALDTIWEVAGEGSPLCIITVKIHPSISFIICANTLRIKTSPYSLVINVNVTMKFTKQCLFKTSEFKKVYPIHRCNTFRILACLASSPHQERNTQIWKKKSMTRGNRSVLNSIQWKMQVCSDFSGFFSNLIEPSNFLERSQAVAKARNKQSKPLGLYFW